MDAEQMIAEDIAALSDVGGSVEREGIIHPGSVEWFPVEQFEGWLWGFEDCVWLSLIISKQPGAGNLSKLFESIWQTGRTVKVPTPFAHMRAILTHKGFEPIPDPNCEVWAKAPVSLSAIKEREVA